MRLGHWVSCQIEHVLKSKDHAPWLAIDPARQPFSSEFKLNLTPTYVTYAL
jgi:hypothetical protein